jgi:hypothetical protein
MEAAITVRDGAVLDLGGYTLSVGGSQRAVQLEGHGAVLKNGRIGTCLTVCVELDGDGGHLIEHVTLDQSPSTDVGFLVRSGGNRLASNQADRFFIAFEVIGSSNGLMGNISVAADVSFFVPGDGNRLWRNTSSQPFAGLIIDGNANRIIGNVVSETFDRGISVSGEGNLLLLNVVEGLSID